MQTDTHTYS